MCGIIAQINLNAPIDRMTFDTMRDTMAHRGPDGAGSKFFDQDRVALGHRRLSIIDLSAAGKQPMCNEDKTLWLTFNGEIYNYRALRKTLETRGHQFQSNTDSEVLIHGYEEWGTSLADHLKGMFAFGIWNSSEKTFFVARDRFGIKPLCYYQDADTFIVASELKAIVTSPNVPAKLNPQAVADYFIYRYVPSPRTIWLGIHKLPPACCMIINEDGTSRSWNYWKPTFGQKSMTEKLAVEQLDALIEKSVNDNLISDAPVGLFLSGGMDSTAIGHYVHKKGLRLNTFSVGFKNWERSEHKEAQIVAEAFETMHHELLLENAFSGLVDDLTCFFDEPPGGTAFMPTYLVSKLASEHVKVVLAGHGGDEVFAGYNWHHNLHRDWYLRIRTKVKRGIKGNRKFFLDKAFAARSVANWHFTDLKKLINPDLFSGLEKQNDYTLFSGYYDKNFSPLKNAQAIDVSQYNEFNLSFLDKATMANSIEGRVPLLDHELVDFVLNLDEKVYYRYRENKYLMKQLLRPHVSQKIIDKPKSGFGFKIHRFIPLTQIEKEIKDSNCYKTSGLFNPGYLDQLFKVQDSPKTWCLYIFCKWFDRWDREVGISIN